MSTRTLNHNGNHLITPNSPTMEHHMRLDAHTFADRSESNAMYANSVHKYVVCCALGDLRDAHKVIWYEQLPHMSAHTVLIPVLTRKLNHGGSGKHADALDAHISLVAASSLGVGLLAVDVVPYILLLLRLTTALATASAPNVFCTGMPRG